MSTAAKNKPAAKPSKGSKPAPAKTGKVSTGLRKPQIRILEALAKAKKPMSRKEISEKAPVDLAFCTEYVGSHDEDVRKKNDAKFPCLITLGMVKYAPSGDATGGHYEITDKGRKAVAK
jgi:hypothetical protein